MSNMNNLYQNIFTSTQYKAFKEYLKSNGFIYKGENNKYLREKMAKLKHRYSLGVYKILESYTRKKYMMYFSCPSYVYIINKYHFCDCTITKAVKDLKEQELIHTIKYKNSNIYFLVPFIKHDFDKYINLFKSFLLMNNL